MKLKDCRPLAERATTTTSETPSVVLSVVSLETDSPQADITAISSNSRDEMMLRYSFHLRIVPNCSPARATPNSGNVILSPVCSRFSELTRDFDTLTISVELTGAVLSVTEGGDTKQETSRLELLQLNWTTPGDLRVGVIVNWYVSVPSWVLATLSDAVKRKSALDDVAGVTLTMDVATPVTWLLSRSMAVTL